MAPPRITLATIAAYEKNQTSEGLHLDFKRAASPDFSGRDDRHTLAEAISGFANAEGGVIVWGVDCRKVEGVDCVSSLHPIPNIRKFVSRLNELTPEAVSPPLAGVSHKAIAKPNGSGFAVTVIPESSIGPHMAKLGVDRYFRRNGAAFLRMEHYEIADMFGRRQKPQLELAHRWAYSDTPRIVVSITNSGRASAHAPYLAVKIRHGPYTFDYSGPGGAGFEGMKRVPLAHSKYHLAYAENADFVIHPQTTRDVFVLRNSSDRNAERDFEMDYALCCDGFTLVEAVLVIPVDRLNSPHR